MMRVTIGPTAPQPPGGPIGPGAAGVPHEPPSGFVMLTSSSPDIERVAKSLLSGDWGAVTLFSIEDRRYAARVEPHPPDPPVGPATWHKGITVYIDPRPLQQGVPVSLVIGGGILAISLLSALYLWRSAGH